MKRQISDRPRISVRNLQRKIAVNVDELQKFSQSAAEACLRLRQKVANGLGALNEISILIISDRRMAELHLRFMNESGPTDVITFQHGEIFISADTAQANAKRFETSVRHELRLYIVHGLLHLHGFDDR
ncbi:MAG TPA: rRNA maturation RNase YbeY, partial [Chthoniobacterales bacterium]|nr:rRNA maturation RNase YbeY [Chthoniobacterales bacterium]